MLSKIKQRDNTIYDAGTQLFSEEDEEEDEQGDGEGGSDVGSDQGNGRKEKQTRLKDVLARQVRLHRRAKYLMWRLCSYAIRKSAHKSYSWPTGPGGCGRNKRR